MTNELGKLLLDKVAVVTGATAGIGHAIALKLAQNGAKVVVIGTNAERGAKVVEEIRSLTGEDRAVFYAVDVSNTVAVEECMKNVLAGFGHIDILINNAGITRDQLLMRMSEQDWDSVLAINLKSCYNTCHAVARSMMKARSGRIINVSSVVGLNGNAGQTNYAASKAGMIGFSKALAKELAARNVLVNCIAPGFIETAMTESLTTEQKKAILDQTPLGRMGNVDEIANAALFLASDLSSYITGQVLTVDGGMVM